MWPVDWCVLLCFHEDHGRSGGNLFGKKRVGWLISSLVKIRSAVLLCRGEPVTSSLCSYCGILWFSPWRISDSEDTGSATYTITESRVRASRGHPWISVCPGRSTKSECIRTCHRDAGTASPAATPVHYIPSTSPRVAFCDIPNLQSLTHTYVQSRHHARRRPSHQLASSLPPSLV